MSSNICRRQQWYDYFPAAMLAGLLGGIQSALAQPPAPPPVEDEPPRLNAVFDGVGLGNAPIGNPGGGGAAAADFDALIDLITSTVESETWQENGTGEGQIMPFDINGVYVDAAGSLDVTSGRSSATLASIRQAGSPRSSGAKQDKTPTYSLRQGGLARLMDQADREARLLSLTVRPF